MEIGDSPRSGYLGFSANGHFSCPDESCVNVLMQKEIMGKELIFRKKQLSKFACLELEFYFLG